MVQFFFVSFIAFKKGKNSLTPNELATMAKDLAVIVLILSSKLSISGLKTDIITGIPTLLDKLDISSLPSIRT